MISLWHKAYNPKQSILSKNHKHAVVYKLVTFKDIELPVLFNVDRGYAYGYIYCSERDTGGTVLLNFIKSLQSRVYTHKHTHTHLDSGLYP